jgi:signal transduction histidine kinase
MNGVIGMVQLLMTTELSAEQRGYAETVESSGRALLALINDILDLSKIEAGKIVIESLEFDVRRTVSDVIELLGVQASAKGLTFGARVSAELPALLRGDPNRLRQVLNNLVANALRDAAGDGPGVRRGAGVDGTEACRRADGRALQCTAAGPDPDRRG